MSGKKQRISGKNIRYTYTFLTTRFFIYCIIVYDIIYIAKELSGIMFKNRET